MFSIGLHHCIFPRTVLKGSLFCHILIKMLFLVFLIITIVTGVRFRTMVSCLFGNNHANTVIFIFISLIISDVEHLFMCLLSISMSSLEKRLFRSSAYFSIGLLVIPIFIPLSCFIFIEALFENIELFLTGFHVVMG